MAILLEIYTREQFEEWLAIVRSKSVSSSAAKIRLGTSVHSLAELAGTWRLMSFEATAPTQGEPYKCGLTFLRRSTNFGDALQ